MFDIYIIFVRTFDINIVQTLDIMSESIKSFLKDHSLISISGLEKLIKMPVGTIRISDNRTIPEKYIKQIGSILVNYGLVQTLDIKKEVVQTLDKPIIKLVQKFDKRPEKVIKPEPLNVEPKKPSHKFINGHFVPVE